VRNGRHAAEATIVDVVERQIAALPTWDSRLPKAALCWPSSIDSGVATDRRLDGEPGGLLPLRSVLAHKDSDRSVMRTVARSLRFTGKPRKWRTVHTT